MSDTVKKYFEMVEDGHVFEPLEKGKSFLQGQFLEWLLNKPEYTEIELVETVVAIARHYKDAKPELILQMAKDELSVKKVCD